MRIRSLVGIMFRNLRVDVLVLVVDSGCACIATQAPLARLHQSAPFPYQGTARRAADHLRRGAQRSGAAQGHELAPRGLVVIDEVQNSKNPTAAQSRAVKSIPAGGFVAMSGTPVG